MFQRLLLAAAILLFVPLTLMTHGFGIVLHALAMDVAVRDVALRLTGFPEVALGPHDHPLLLLLGGTLWALIIPILLWLIAAKARVSWAYLLQFFTVCSWLIHGAYWVAGYLLGFGEPMMLHVMGLPWWAMCGAGAVMVIVAMSLSRGLAEAFGLSQLPPQRGLTPVMHSLAVLLLAVLLLAIFIWFSEPQTPIIALNP